MSARSFQTTLKRLRRTKGLSQYALANQAGVSQQYLNELEAGKKKNPGIETVYKLAKALKVKVAELLE